MGIKLEVLSAQGSVPQHPKRSHNWSIDSAHDRRLPWRHTDLGLEERQHRRPQDLDQRSYLSDVVEGLEAVRPVDHLSDAP